MQVSSGAGDEVFRCDHLEAFVLAADFRVDGCGDFGVGEGERLRHAVRHEYRLQRTGNRVQNQGLLTLLEWWRRETIFLSSRREERQIPGVP